MRDLQSMTRLLSVIVLLHTLPLLAAENRIEFHTVRGGEFVDGSEVCFFPAVADDGFFQKFLSTDDVRCLSADVVLSLPRGFFNVFARNGNALVSAHPIFIDNSNPSEGGYRQMEVVLLPAATLDVTAAKGELGKDEWLAIYISNESQAQSPASAKGP